MQLAFLLLLFCLFLSPVLPSCAPVPCPAVDPTGPVRFLAVNGTNPHVDCPTSFPTRVVPAYTPVSFQCCGAGVRTIEWLYATPEDRSAFSIKTKFFNQTELCITEIDPLDEGFYKCRLTGWDGRQLERIQRLAVVATKTVGEHINISFQENCEKSALSQPVLGDSSEVTCTVQTSTTPESFLELRLIKDGANISRCFIRPLCIRLEPEKYQNHSQDIAFFTCSPPGDDMRLRVILQSTGPEVEVRIDSDNVRKDTRLQLIAWDGRRPPISAFFRISPLGLLLWWHFLLMTAAIVLFLSAASSLVFLGWRDIQLLFTKKPPLTEQTERLPVVLLSSDTSQPITAELAQQLTANLGRHFATSRRFLPDFEQSFAGAATTAALAAAGANCLTVVLLDAVSFRSALFVGLLKALLMRRGGMRVYVVMETFRRMRRENHTELEFVERLIADAKYHPLVRSHWRPTDWVLRQVRLAMEQERRAGWRKRGLGGALVSTIDAKVEAEAETVANVVSEKKKKLLGRHRYSSF